MSADGQQKPAHTPGPWIANSCGVVLTEARSPAGHRATIAECNSPSAEVDLANARLIAAAPDLLEALRALEILASRWLPYQDQDAINEARAAIAKAEGRS